MNISELEARPLPYERKNRLESSWSVNEINDGLAGNETTVPKPFGLLCTVPNLGKYRYT
jgi:hypothetical protein